MFVNRSPLDAVTVTFTVISPTAVTLLSLQVVPDEVHERILLVLGDVLDLTAIA